MFTLSPKSVAVLHELDKDVDLYVFMSRGEPNFGHTEELIQRYKAASPRLKVHYVDPDREPGEFKLLAQRFGVMGGDDAGPATTVRRRRGRGRARRQELAREPRRPGRLGHGAPGEDGAQEQVSVKAEQALTGAIVQVVSGRATKVCVTKGHGEWSLEESAERSLASLKLGLRHDNIEWQAFETLGSKEVPKELRRRARARPDARVLRARGQADARLRARGRQRAARARPGDRARPDRSRPASRTRSRRVGVRLDNVARARADEKHLLSPNPVEFVGDRVRRPRHHARRSRAARASCVALARSLSVLEQEPTASSR